MGTAAAETSQQVRHTVAQLLHDLSSEHLLGVVAGLLGGFPQDRWDISPKQRCDMILAASAVASQAQAVKALLIAEADQHDATLRSAGTPAATFIASRTNVSKKQAAGDLYDAQRLGSVPKARDAALDGSITIGHARAVGAAMGQMPTSFTPEQTRVAEDLFVQLAQTRTPDEVLAAAPRVAAEVDPVDADRPESERLTREREQAWKDRSLSWWKDRGSIGFKGSLPRPDNAPLSAGDLRRLCCDANLVPAVLGADSEPLDIGRAGRFVTPPIRKALTLRDKHCAFPRCDTPAIRCDAHHLVPWWDGGPTTMSNLVLLCPEHHGLIEPDRNASRDQWQVHINSDGHPVFTPPGRFGQPDPAMSSCHRQELEPPLFTTGTDPPPNDG